MAAQAFMERAADRAAAVRERRLQRLQRRRQILRKARFALQELSAAGEDPPEIRVGYGNPGVACELEVRSSLGFGA